MIRSFAPAALLARISTSAFRRRAIALAVALVPSIVFAATPHAASAMKIAIEPITADYLPSYQPCPYRASWNAVLKITDYTGTPSVALVYHWETTGLTTGSHFQGKDKTAQTTLRDLAQMATIPGLTPDEIYAEYQIGPLTVGPFDRFNLRVKLVVTAPQHVEQTFTYTDTCHT